jgi:AraC-like DNA-binding protein
MTHNDQAVRLAVGDVAFVDAAQPVTYFADNNGAPWNTVTLNLPRQSLVSHLGFEPKGGLYRRGGTPAGRLLFDLIQETDGGEGSAFSPADSYMQLAVYDLVGALFAPSDLWPVSRHADKLFTRICGVIKDRFADPDFGPCEVAAEAGISLRYLQKLFTQRGSTCSEFIYSLRLDYAARLLHRRAFLATNQPVSEIAHASGFRDYRNFARKFRHRFGRSPCAYAGDHTWPRAFPYHRKCVIGSRRLTSGGLGSICVRIIRFGHYGRKMANNCRLKFKLRQHRLVTKKIERSIHARGCRSCRRR